MEDNKKKDDGIVGCWRREREHCSSLGERRRGEEREGKGKQKVWTAKL